MANLPAFTRRQFNRKATALLGLSLFPIRTLGASRAPALISKPIPKTKEYLPVIGMGTWITFNVGNSRQLRAQRARVLDTFFSLGGKIVDSSPMYGSAEQVMGDCLRLTGTDALFSATKTWTSSTAQGMQQFTESQDLWGLTTFDLLQIHNLVNWRNHLTTLRSLKDQKKIKYIGITTSHGRRHSEVEEILKTQEIDFLQLTYNIADREAELKLLPLAQEKGVAVIANRPFQGGHLPDVTSNMELPDVAKELGCRSWPQLLLNFTVSHPAITCAIPATSNEEHMRENMLTLTGKLANNEQRESILSAYLQQS